MMHFVSRTVFCLAIAIGCATIAAAQDTGNAHWGVQGDVSTLSVPELAVKQIDARIDKPRISGNSFGVGLVRFSRKGAPSYALQYSSMRVSFDGGLWRDQMLDTISGAGRLRGFLATKYVNFVARKYVSGGLALGGGVGKLDAAYRRLEILRGVPIMVESNTYNLTFPLFEILGRVEVRPVRFVSVGPYYGIRNGTLAAGIAVRIHAVR